MADIFSLQNYQGFIEPIIATAQVKECSHFYGALRIASKQEAAGSVKLSVLKLFEDVMSFMLVTDSPNEIFKPQFITPIHRGALPQDLSISQLTFFESILPDIKDDELKARIADTLWSLRYGKTPALHARTAMHSYLSSSEILLVHSWPYSYKRLARALQIYLHLGLKKGPVSDEENVPQKIYDYIEKEQYSDLPFLAIKLITLLYEAGLEDKERHLEILESLAAKATEVHKFDTARKAWELTAKLYRKYKKNGDGLRCEINAAEMYIAEADFLELEPSGNKSMAVAHFLQKAVEAYRQISGNEQRKEELYNRLIEVQSKVTLEMKTFSTEIDLSEISKYAQDAVSGKNIIEALYNFANIFPLRKIDDIKEALLRQAEVAPLSSMLSSSVVDSQGRVIANVESELDKMYRYVSQYHRAIYVRGAFWPALQKIREEHFLCMDEWMQLLKDHPFVPPERLHTYVHGFFHGFHGDFIAAAHILIPQLENSIRYLLKSYEKETSKPVVGGLQEESGLNQTLAFPELEEILGKDLVFELKGLLVEKAGDNLRHRVSHGLVGDSELYAHLPAYLYWLVLYIIFLPMAVRS